MQWKHWCISAYKHLNMQTRHSYASTKINYHVLASILLCKGSQTGHGLFIMTARLIEAPNPF